MTVPARREAAGGGGRRRLATASASPIRPTQKRSVACAIGRIMKLTTAGSASEAIRLSSSSPKRQAACGGGGVPSAASSGAVDLCKDGPLRLSNVGPAAVGGSSASAQAGSSSERSSRRWFAIGLGASADEELRLR